MKGLSRFKRAFVSTFTLDVVARGMSAITLVLLLREMSVEGFAFIVLLLNVGQFVGSAVTGGIRLRYTRLEAERVSRGADEPSAFHATLVTGSWLVLAAAVLGFLGATGLGIGVDAGERLLFVGLATGYTLAHAATDLATFHFQAQLSFVRGGLVQVARSAALLVAAVAATAGLLDSGTEVGLAFAVGAGAVALVVVGPLAIATRGAPHGLEGRFGFGKESAALTLYSISSSAWAYLDLFLVAALLNDVAIASYGASLRYISLLMGPVPAIVAVVRIRTAQKDLVDSDEAQIEMMRTWARRTALPAFVILASGAVAATWAIPLIDEGHYPKSVPIFQILLIGAFAKLVTLPNSSLLITQMRYTTLAWVNAAAVTVNVAAAVVAAMLFGVIGIAVAAVAVSVLQVLTVTYLAANPPPRAPAGPPRPAVAARGDGMLEP